MFGKRRPMFFREIQARVLRNDFLQNFYIPGKLLQMIGWFKEYNSPLWSTTM